MAKMTFGEKLESGEIQTENMTIKAESVRQWSTWTSRQDCPDRVRRLFAAVREEIVNKIKTQRPDFKVLDTDGVYYLYQWALRFDIEDEKK